MDAFTNLLAKERRLKQMHVAHEMSLSDGMNPRLIGYRGGNPLIAASVYSEVDREPFDVAMVIAAGASCDEIALLFDVAMRSAEDPTDRRDTLITVKADRRLNVRFAAQFYEIQNGTVLWGETEHMEWKDGMVGQDMPFMDEAREIMCTPTVVEQMLVAGEYNQDEITEPEAAMLSMLSTMSVIKDRGHDVSGFVRFRDKPLLDRMIDQVKDSGRLADGLEFKLY